MFTGIIEETGTLKNITRGTRSGKITVSCRQVLEGTRIGDSIAVNGICLTVTERGGDWFSADATPETFRRTSLGSMRAGELLNLERGPFSSGPPGEDILSQVILTVPDG